MCFLTRSRLCHLQPGGGGGSNHVHLGAAGAGRGLRSAGRWRRAGPGQTGEARTNRRGRCRP